MEGAILVHFTPKGPYPPPPPAISISLAECKKFYEEEDFHSMKKSLARCNIG
jgi:hypothetical protein